VRVAGRVRRGRLDAVNRRPTLSLNEWAVLGLLVEQPRHGYDIAAELQPDAEVGEVWRLPRALVYRAIGRLEALGMVCPEATERGGGPPRTVYGATPAGTRRFGAWLAAPVDHLRELRAGFLLKLVLARRAGVDRTELVRAQLRRLDAQFTALAEPPPAGDPVALWRHHSALAARAFLEALDRG
jgi:PadR family transcriptional regulator AphA